MALQDDDQDTDLIRGLNVLGKPSSFSLEGPPDVAAGGGLGTLAPPTFGGGAGEGGPGGSSSRGGSGIGPRGRVTISPERSNLPDLSEDTGIGVNQLGAIARLLGEAGKLVPGAAPSHAMSENTRGQFEAQRAGERTLATPPDTSFLAGLQALQSETPGILGAIEGPGAGLLFGSPEAAGAAGGQVAEAALAPAGAAAEGAGTAGSLGSALGQVASIGGPALASALSAYKAAMAENDFDKGRAALHSVLYAIGPLTGGITAGVAGVADALDAIIQAFGGPSPGELFGFGPSEDWLSFGERLEGNLGTTGTSLEQLGMDIVNAGSDEDITGAVARYKQAIGGFAGGFGEGTGPYDIPVPPGATGTEHEGGLTADWGDAVTQLTAMLAAKRAGLEAPGPTGEAPLAPTEAPAPAPESPPTSTVGPIPSAPPPPPPRAPHAEGARGGRLLDEDEDELG